MIKVGKTNKQTPQKKNNSGLQYAANWCYLKVTLLGETLHIDQLLSRNTIGYAGICSQHSFLSVIFRL